MAQELKPLQLDITPPKPSVTVLPAEAPGAAQLIEADNDVEAVRQWLSEYWNRPNTYPAYRKEAERLLLWLREEAGKSLSQMRREDWQAYERFLRRPPPHWCGPPHKRGDPKWRPFRGPLSESSVRYAISVLKDMVRYLCVAGYLKVNPLLLERTPRQSRIKKVERFLPPGSYRAIMAALDEMPRDTPRARRRYERALFVFVWTEATGARTSELINTRMAHIHGDFRSEKTRWWWRVIGKGGKESDVPLNSVAVEALKRYRRHLGLYRALPDPATESEYALIWGAQGALEERARGVSRATLYRLTKDVFSRAAEILKASDSAAAQHLLNASTHWLRHSTATNALDDGVPLNDVKELMRHASMDTLLQYVHKDKEALHESVQTHRHRFNPATDGSYADSGEGV